MNMKGTINGQTGNNQPRAKQAAAMAKMMEDNKLSTEEQAYQRRQRERMNEGMSQAERAEIDYGNNFK